MSTKSQLQGLFGPQARIRDADRVPSGSPGQFVLRPETGFFRTVDAARVLARRGVPLRVAKPLVERLMNGHATAVEIPMVEDRAALARDLAETGVKLDDARMPTGADLASLRQRLSLSQEQFAGRYALELRTLQNWEQGRNRLDPQAALLVKALDRYPELMEAVAIDA